MGKNATYLYNEFNVDKDDPQWKQLKKAFDTDAKEAYNVSKKNKGTTDGATSIIRYGSIRRQYEHHHLRFAPRPQLPCAAPFCDPRRQLLAHLLRPSCGMKPGTTAKLHGYMYRIYSRDPQMVGKEKQPTTISMLNDGSMIQYDKDTGLSTVVQSRQRSGRERQHKVEHRFPLALQHPAFHVHGEDRAVRQRSKPHLRHQRLEQPAIAMQAARSAARRQ